MTFPTFTLLQDLIKIVKLILAALNNNSRGKVGFYPPLIAKETKPTV